MLNQGVWDEAGDIKQGTEIVAVAGQYRGVTGQVENCQVAVFAAYASKRGRALVDAELYLPKEWVADPGRAAGAGIPPGRRGYVATKGQLAAGMPFAYAAGDEVYGRSPGPAHRDLASRHRIRTRSRLRPAHRRPAGRSSARPGAPARPAVAFGRNRCERAADARLGLGRARQGLGPVSVALGGAGFGALTRAGADVRGRLGLDQLLQQPLGELAHRVGVLRGTQCIEQGQQGRLVQSHRVWCPIVGNLGRSR